MTGTTYDGRLSLKVSGRSWRREQRPPLSLTVLERPDRLLVLPSDQSGGLRGGDRVVTEVSVDQGGQVEWRPPTSGLFFPSVDRKGTCVVSARLGVTSGSRLAWIPPVAIPCAGARIDQSVWIEGEPGAELLYWDGWADGRTASGERGAFARISNQLEVRWGGKIVFRERWSLDGGRPGLPDPAGFQGACQWHLALAAGPESIHELVARIQAWQAAGEAAEWGDLGDGLVIGRVLARRPRVSPWFPLRGVERN